MRAVKREGRSVVWSCDPDARQHGDGRRTARRPAHFDRILSEVQGVLRRASRRGHPSRRRAFRDDRPGRHRVHRRRDRRSPTTSSPSATRRSAIRGSTPARRWSLPSCSPSSSRPSACRVARGATGRRSGHRGARSGQGRADDAHPSDGESRALHRSLLQSHQAGDRPVRRRPRDLRDLHAPAGGVRAAPGARLARGAGARRATPRSRSTCATARASGSAPASR